MMHKIRIFLTLVALSISADAFSQSATPVWDEVLLNPDETVATLSFQQSENYCRRHGMRLPTERDFLGWMHQHGAVGIVPTSFPDTPYIGLTYMTDDPQSRLLFDELDFHLNRDHDFFFRTNASGTRFVDFYFDPTGLQQDTWRGFYWVSSGRMVYTRTGHTVDSNPSERCWAPLKEDRAACRFEDPNWVTLGFTRCVRDVQPVVPAP